jgi:hypothetical protein
LDSLALTGGFVSHTMNTGEDLVRDVHSPNRLWMIRPIPEFFRRFVQPSLQPSGLDVLERLTIHTCGPAVNTAAAVGVCQDILSVQLVTEAIEAVVGRSLRFGMQRRLQIPNRLGSWQTHVNLLGDVPAATAILDRFLHHAEIITITGRSYRLKDKAAKDADKSKEQTKDDQDKNPGS